MNARATLSNGKTVKGNSCGTVIVQATQVNFEENLKMCAKYKDSGDMN
jgi:hypothetical protein